MAHSFVSAFPFFGDKTDLNQFVQLAIESRGRDVVRKKDLCLLSKYFSKNREWH